VFRPWDDIIEHLILFIYEYYQYIFARGNNVFLSCHHNPIKSTYVNRNIDENVSI
jgi:hypothetical protein